MYQLIYKYICILKGVHGSHIYLNQSRDAAKQNTRVDIANTHV